MPLHGGVHLSSTSSWQVVPPGGAGLALACRQVSRSPTGARLRCLCRASQSARRFLPSSLPSLSLPRRDRPCDQHRLARLCEHGLLQNMSVLVFSLHPMTRPLLATGPLPEHAGWTDSMPGYVSQAVRIGQNKIPSGLTACDSPEFHRVSVL